MSYFDDNEEELIYGRRPPGPENNPFAPHKVECNRCGAKDLIWSHDGRKWYLTNTDCNAHVCNNDNAIDDFEVLE